MVRDYTDVIFENYEMFLKEHRDEMATPAGALEMLSSDGAFRSYMNCLTEGLDPNSKAVVMAVAQREREMLLEESINFGPSASVVGYNVTYFPILTDIYSDPIISQVATTYPIGKSLITIPKVKVRASVTNTDGSKANWVIPRDTYLVRGTGETLTLTPNASNNLFTLSGLGTDDVTVNKRYFMINKVVVTDDATPANTHNVAMSVRADARGQVASTFSFVDANNANATITGSMIGNIDFDRGVVQFSITYAVPQGVTASYSTVSADAAVVFSPKKSDVGRVKVSLDVQGWDKTLMSHVSVTMH